MPGGMPFSFAPTYRLRAERRLPRPAVPAAARMSSNPPTAPGLGIVLADGGAGPGGAGPADTDEVGNVFAGGIPVGGIPGGTPEGTFACGGIPEGGPAIAGGVSAGVDSPVGTFLAVGGGGGPFLGSGFGSPSLTQRPSSLSK